jgi:hypothetical protein
MKPGFVCVAGLDDDNRHVRPVLERGQLSSDMLRSRGGCFELAGFVELGKTHATGKPPEREDEIIDPSATKFLRMEEAVAFWKRLDKVAEPKLKGIFGADLRPDGRGASVAVGMGKASLGVLRPSTRPKLYVNAWNKLRLDLSDGEFDLELAVTDLRLYEKDWKSPNEQLVSKMSASIMNADVLVCVGLGRPWAPANNPPARPWLQANNILIRP